MLKVILNRLKLQVEKIYHWRTGRLQSRKEHHRADLQPKNPLWEIHPTPARPLPCLHSFKKALERVCQAVLWATMKKHNIHANHIRIIKHFSDKATSAILFNSSIGDWFQTTTGVWHGCVLSPTLFNIHLVCRITKRWIEVCFQPWDNPLWFTGLISPTNCVKLGHWSFERVHTLNRATITFVQVISNRAQDVRTCTTNSTTLRDLTVSPWVLLGDFNIWRSSAYHSQFSEFTEK